MTPEEIKFKEITDNLSYKFENVAPGKMMSSPGITYKKKVFSFFYKDKMVFRLGNTFNFSEVGIENYELLNPFRNKPPFKDKG